MPRIPQAEIERLKSEVSVERLVEASGTLLKKSGKDWLGRCPFHKDDTAREVIPYGCDLNQQQAHAARYAGIRLQTKTRSIPPALAAAT